MNKALIRVTNATKIFNSAKGFSRKNVVTKALNNVDLTVLEGETLGIVGESGSGKTTLGRCIIGLEQLTTGDVYYQNQLLDDKTRSSLGNEMQIIFQDPYSALNPMRSALESVMEPLLIGMNKKQAKEKALEMLRLVGIDASSADKLPRAFSGGQRQRIGIARAIVTNPTFVLCDEPTSALDVSIQRQVLQLLKEVQSKLDLTYLFISHDLSVVRFISDRIAVMYKGELVELGLAEDVFEQPIHEYTKRLLLAAPLTNPIEARKQLFAFDSFLEDIELSDTFEWIEVSKGHFVRKCR